MNQPPSLEVYLSESDAPRFIGTLRPSFQGGVLASSSFEYDPSFLRDGYAISMDLPLHSGRQWAPASSTLFGAFSDAAPDEWGQRIIAAARSRTAKATGQRFSRLSEFDYLVGVADETRMGALRFRSPGAEEWLSSDAGVANEHDLSRILAASRRYEAHEATDEDIAYLNGVATSPGGARPKANVRLSGGGLAIAKLPHSKDGDIDVERWEGAVLAIAEQAGLRVPKYRIAAHDMSKAVLVVSRFDRGPQGTRVGYMSASTALGLGSHRSDADVTYLDLADTIADISASPRPELRELYGRIALTIMVNNVDDHWRNHGFVRSEATWKLSPLFDVNPSVHRGLLSSRRISDRSTGGERDIRELVDVADAFRLRPAEAAEVLTRVATAVDDWRSVAARHGIDAPQTEALSSAFDADARAFAHGLAS